MKINFAGVKTEFEPVEDGIYDCTFPSYRMGKTKEKGDPKVDLTFAVAEEGEYHNRRLFRTCTFTQESLWVFKKSMIALGADVNWEDPEGIDPDEICRSVLNNHCLVKVVLDPEGYEDPITKAKKPSNRILDVLPTDALRLEMAEAAATSVATGAGND